MSVSLNLGTVTTDTREFVRLRVWFDHDATDYPARVGVVRCVRADSACGYTLKSSVVRLPILRWATAYRARRLGALRVYRAQESLLRRLARR